MADYKMLDGLQQAVIEEEQKKKANQKKTYEFDRLALYFGEDYEVKGIKISQPSIGDILSVGESNFYQSLSPFLYNSTSIRVMLWDDGIDWCTVKDIEVFSMLSNTPEYNKDPLGLLFKNIDITKFKLSKVKFDEELDEEFCLYDKEHNWIIKENEYMEIAEYIREMLNVHPKVEKAKGRTTKKWMIDEDRMNILHKDNKKTSTLLPLISACVNHPGFKYKLQELRDVGIYQFMDSVQRLQIYESTRALSQGRFSGFCDLSGVPDENFNFMREI